MSPEKVRELRFPKSLDVLCGIAAGIDPNETCCAVGGHTTPTHYFRGVFDSLDETLGKHFLARASADKLLSLVTKELHPSFICEDDSLPVAYGPVAIAKSKVESVLALSCVEKRLFPWFHRREIERNESAIDGRR